MRGAAALALFAALGCRARQREADPRAEALDRAVRDIERVSVGGEGPGSELVPRSLPPPRKAPPPAAPGHVPPGLSKFDFWLNAQAWREYRDHYNRRRLWAGQGDLFGCFTLALSDPATLLDFRVRGRLESGFPGEEWERAYEERILRGQDFPFRPQDR